MNIEERAEAALKYLVDSDELAADLRFEASKAEARHEAIIDTKFLVLEGSIEVRKAAARRSPESEQAYFEYLEAVRAYDAVANKRKSEALVIEWLRSLNANRRQGQ